MRFSRSARLEVEDLGRGEYPVLETLIPQRGADVATVATAILADRTSLLAIEDVATAAKDSIDSQSNQDGIDSAFDAVVWP